MSVYKKPSSLARSSYGLGATPETIVISKEGRVVKNWIGAYVGENLSGVNQFFGVHLDGM
jgi:hypothetical protein